MKAIEVDARRYAWCRGHALWIAGMEARSSLEDVHGAHRAKQEGLLRYAARMLGEACAVAAAVALFHARPIPPSSSRGPWALERLRGHDLWLPCWELFRGVDEEGTEEVLLRCDILFAKTREIVGEIPDILTPEGHYPAMAAARDWLKLMNAVGEDGFLPDSWTSPV